MYVKKTGSNLHSRLTLQRHGTLPGSHGSAATAAGRHGTLLGSHGSAATAAGRHGTLTARHWEATAAPPPLRDAMAHHIISFTSQHIHFILSHCSFCGHRRLLALTPLVPPHTPASFPLANPHTGCPFALLGSCAMQATRHNPRPGSSTVIFGRSLRMMTSDLTTMLSRDGLVMLTSSTMMWW